MKNLESLIKDTINVENFYMFEKTYSAISKDNIDFFDDIDFAKRLLSTFGRSYSELNKQIETEDYYSDYYLDTTFKTLQFSISKLHELLGNIITDENKYEAYIHHSYIKNTDKDLRSTFSEIIETTRK